MDIETVLLAYIDCALWSSSDDHDTPLDTNYDGTDLTEHATEAMRADCREFMSNCADLDLGDMDAAAFGHDFWLTRNGHGAGFWDRGLGDLGETLTERCESFGSCDLYVTEQGDVDVL